MVTFLISRYHSIAKLLNNTAHFHQEVCTEFPRGEGGGPRPLWKANRRMEDYLKVESVEADCHVM